MPKSIIFGIEISWIFVCRSKERHKSGQGRHKSGQEGPKSDQERPYSGPRAAKSGQKRPRAAQEWPRAAPAVGLVVEQKMSQVGGIGR